MADIAEASLPSVVEALREAGYEPRPAAWISLSFDQSASPLVLPRPRWQRDVDFDRVRLGLLGHDRIPMP